MGNGKTHVMVLYYKHCVH